MGLKVWCLRAMKLSLMQGEFMVYLLPVLFVFVEHVGLMNQAGMNPDWISCLSCCCCFFSCACFCFFLFFISPQGEPLARGTRLKGIKETRRLVGWLCVRLKIWCLRAMKLNLMQNYVHGLPTPIGLMSVPITARLTVDCFLLLSMLDFFLSSLT